MPRGLAFILIFVGAMLLGLMAGSFRHGEPFAPEFYEPDPWDRMALREDNPRVERAASDGEMLWVSTNTGEIWTLMPGPDAAPGRLHTPEPVLDFCLDGDRVTTVTTGANSASSMTLRTLDHSGVWRTVTHWDATDGLVALLCEGGETAVLTSTRLLVIRDGEIRSTRLSFRLPQHGSSVALKSHGAILVGLDIGEWGGGVHSVDLGTGTVGLIHSNVSGDLCGGPLNTDCDPVWSMARSPWGSGCAVVAIAKLHLGIAGRLVEVCGADVRLVHVGRCPRPEFFDWMRLDDSEADICSEPFYSVAAIPAGIVAAGVDGWTRIDLQGRVKKTAYGRLSSRGPFRVRFEDDVILIDRELSGRPTSLDNTMMVLPRHPPPPAPPPATPSPL